MEKKPPKKRHEVLLNGLWVKAADSEEYLSGWLRYEIRFSGGDEPLRGVAKPRHWRVYEPTAKGNNHASGPKKP